MTLSRRGRRFERRAQARRSLREQALERFGQDADERSSDRRQPGTPDQLDARMRAAGVFEDRRRGDRRR